NSSSCWRSCNITTAITIPQARHISSLITIPSLARSHLLGRHPQLHPDLQLVRALQEIFVQILNLADKRDAPTLLAGDLVQVVPFFHDILERVCSRRGRGGLGFPRHHFL